MRLLAILIISCLLFACTTSYDSAAKSWQGKNASALVTRWGIPSEKIVTDTSTTYIYRITTRYPVATTSNYVMVVNHGGKSTAIGAAVPSSNPQYVVTSCVASFVTDKNNVIVAVSYQGGACSEAHRSGF